MKRHFAYRHGAARYHTLARASALTLAGAGLLAAACSNSGEEPDEQGGRIPITSQGSALTAVENTELALQGILDSGGFLADSTSLAETLNSLGGSSQSCSGSVSVCDPSDVDCVPQVTEECTTDEVTEEDLREVREDLRAEVDALVKRLREEVFIEANLDAEGTTETQVTYRLGANVLCASSETPPSNTDPALGAPTNGSPSGEAELDPECVADAEKANLRVRLSQPSPNDVDVTFIATSENYEPLTLQLYRDRLGLRVDLAEGLKTVEAMGQDVGNVDSLEGLLQLQLVKNAPLDYSLQLSVLEALNLSVHDDNDDNLSYSVGATSPTVELRVDGNTKTLSATYNYGTIQLLAPLRMLANMMEGDESTDAATLPSPDAPLVAPEPEPEKTYSGIIEMLVAGYTGTFSYTAESDEFRFNDVSLGQGTSTLKHNGNLLASVDLNPNDGRGLDLVVRAETDAQGGTAATVSIDPTIDLNIAVQFENIADQVEDIPEALLDDKLRMWFEGTSPEFTMGDAQMRMLSGSFHMSSEKNPESNVDLAEGSCLREVDDAPVVSPSEGAPEPAEGENFFGLEVVSCQ